MATETPGHAEGWIDTATVREVAGNLYYELIQHEPLTFAFQTRKGDLGILQIIRYTEEPRGMRIRYKLVQPAKPEKLQPIPPEAVGAIDSVHNAFHSIVKAHKQRDYEALLAAYTKAEAKITESRSIMKGTAAEIPWAQQTDLLLAYGKAALDHHDDRLPALETAMREWDVGKQGQDFRKLMRPLHQPPQVTVELAATSKFLVAKVTRGDVSQTVYATGTLEPEDVRDVSAQVAGQIIRLGDDPRGASDPQYKGKTIDFNTPVKKGMLLARIDPTIYQLHVDRAKAAYDVAEAELKRMLEANKKVAGSVPRENVARAEAEVERCKSALQEAKLKLDYTNIRSPIDGYVIARRVNVGQNVSPDSGQPSMFLIAKYSPNMQIWVMVNEADVGRIRKDMKALFTVDAFPKEEFEGRVIQIRRDATMRQNVVLYTVIVEFKNPGDKLLPYMTASVRFVVETHRNVLLVPVAAESWSPRRAEDVSPSVHWQGSRLAPPYSYLWVKDTDGRHLRPIKVKRGFIDGNFREVSGPDVKEGMEIVVGYNSADEPGDTFVPKFRKR